MLTEHDFTTQWQDDWKSALVVGLLVNSSIVDDSLTPQSGNQDSICNDVTALLVYTLYSLISDLDFAVTHENFIV